MKFSLVKFEVYIDLRNCTDRDSGVRSRALDVCLRNGAHAKLIESSREECCEGGDKRNCPRARAAADGHADEVLFGDEAFDVPLRINLISSKSWRDRSLEIEEANKTTEASPKHHNKTMEGVAQNRWLIEREKSSPIRVCFLELVGVRRILRVAV